MNPPPYPGEFFAIPVKLDLGIDARKRKYMQFGAFLRPVCSG